MSFLKGWFNKWFTVFDTQNSWYMRVGFRSVSLTQPKFLALSLPSRDSSSSALAGESLQRRSVYRGTLTPVASLSGLKMRSWCRSATLCSQQLLVFSRRAAEHQSRQVCAVWSSWSRGLMKTGSPEGCHPPSPAPSGGTGPWPWYTPDWEAPLHPVRHKHNTEVVG